MWRRRSAASSPHRRLPKDGEQDERSEARADGVGQGEDLADGQYGPLGDFS
jgi:hypothetical protein